MKKEYTKPSIEAYKFKTGDFITTSGGLVYKAQTGQPESNTFYNLFYF